MFSTLPLNLIVLTFSWMHLWFHAKNWKSIFLEHYQLSICCCCIQNYTHLKKKIVFCLLLHTVGNISQDLNKPSIFAIWKCLSVILAYISFKECFTQKESIIFTANHWDSAALMLRLYVKIRDYWSELCALRTIRS